MREKQRDISALTITEGKDNPRDTIVVLAYGGMEDAKVRDWVAQFRKTNSVKFVSPEDLPFMSAEGISEVFVDSGNDIHILFPNSKQRQVWSTIAFTRLLHSRDSSNISISISSAPTRRGSDFKVLGEE